MSEKHSPLPWAVDPDDRPGYEWNYHIVSAENPDNRICFMTSDGPSEANAALIVYAVNSHAALAAEIERLREQLVRYQQALRDIVEPVAALKRYADEHDRELDGHLAVQLAKSADHLKGIARAALTDDLRDPDEGLPTADDVRGLPSPKQKAA